MEEQRRLVEVQLQRLVPQTTTVVVSVPHDWDDATIKCELTDIYQAVDVDSHAWQDQDDYDPAEGEHELSGDARPDANVDLVYPVEDDEDADADE
jgi:hypothetical protein